METKEALYNRIKEYDIFVHSLYHDVKEYCQDKSIPLDDRWHVFVTANMGDHFSSITRYTPIVSEYIDTAWCERYETISIDYIMEWYEDKVYDILYKELERDPTPSELDNRLKEDLTEFKEDTLQKFIKSFEHDW